MSISKLPGEPQTTSLKQAVVCGRSPASLQSIRNLQSQGQFEHALLAVKQELTRRSDAALLALAAVLYCQKGELEAAETCLAGISDVTEGLTAETLTDLGGAYILLGKPAQALGYLQAALDLAPDCLLARIRRGLVRLQLGQYALSIADLAPLHNQLPEPQRAPACFNLAGAHLGLGEIDQALSYLEQGLALSNARQIALSRQALLVAVDTYIAHDRWDDAETVIQQTLASGGDRSLCLRALALILAAQDRHEEAEQNLREALRETPADVELLEQLADLAAVRGHYGESRQCLQAALRLEPDNAGLWAQLSGLGKRHFDTHLARQAAEKALELTEEAVGLDRARALVALAAVEPEESDLNNTEAIYREALAQVPGFIPAYLGLGHLLLRWGRVEEAVACFEEVTTRHPIAGYGALIGARRFPEDDAILHRIEQVAYIPSLQGPVQGGLLFDLAATWAYKKEYAKAFRFAEEANRASRKYLPYSAETHRHHCQTLTQVFTRDFFAQRRDYGLDSKLPLFVLGMPRSGTTLVEQMLSGHQEIHGAGEIGLLGSVVQRLKGWERHLGSGIDYPECLYQLPQEHAAHFAQELLHELRAYNPEARHIIDKLPHNFEHIGLIRLLFPKAPIIHVLRESRDVAISNYFTDYQAKFGGMGFAYDLSDIGKQLVDYRSLMRHWNNLSFHPILTVHYEDLIDDAERQVRRMLNYIGLPWDDAVLNHQNLEREVKTASVWQVRQPIYKTSRDKWRRYADFLEPLETELNKSWSEPNKYLTPPQFPPGHFFAGIAHLEAARGQEAAKVFQALLRDYPAHAAATQMLGVAYLLNGQPQRARTLMEKAIRRHPKHSGWYQNLAQVYLALGMNEAAKQVKNKARRIEKQVSDLQQPLIISKVPAEYGCTATINDKKSRDA